MFHKLKNQNLFTVCSATLHVVFLVVTVNGTVAKKFQNQKFKRYNSSLNSLIAIIVLIVNWHYIIIITWCFEPYYMNTAATEVEEDSFGELIETSYGKDSIKLLHHHHEGQRHFIKEIELALRVTLKSDKEYTRGDNSEMMATDSQKNIVYILAKNYGIKNPEEFGLIVTNFFLTKYPVVTSASVHITEFPWTRLEHGGVEHNHAFISNPSATRFTSISIQRGRKPQIESGIQNLRVLKATQSGFQDFITDEYTTLAHVKDRIMSTNIWAKWTYGSTDGINFDDTWNTARDAILESFSGPYPDGVYSPSVQNTLYLTEQNLLRKIPFITKVQMQMPNIHYIPYNFSRFKGLLNATATNEILVPTDKPAGNINAVLGRKHS